MRRRLPLLRRRPPFALVLVTLVAALGGAIALVSAGGSPRTTPTPSTPRPTAGRACVTARAQAAATARDTLRAPVTATVPVSVTERAGTASVTLSERIVERATATQPIEVRRSAVVARRACASGSTTDAARGNALNDGYRAALAAAREQAQTAANRALASFAAQQLPALQRSTRAALQAQAQTAADSARRTLARQALAEARAKAR
jgi:hypothetical protein